MTPDRPEELYPLFKSVESLKGIGGATRAALERMDVRLVRDILLHLPKSIIHRPRVSSITDIEPPAFATIRISVDRHIPGKGGRPCRVQVSDARSTFMLVYFGSRRQHLERLLPVGCVRVVSGKVEAFGSQSQMVHPDYVVEAQREQDIPLKEPLYALTEGVSNRSMRRFVASALEVTPDLEEWHNRAVIEEHKWPSWHNALRIAHEFAGPGSDDERNSAVERLTFDELTANQLVLIMQRRQLRRANGAATEGNGSLRNLVLSNFGHELTAGQNRVLDEILFDLAQPERMIRLLQGDVGSGKTMVAILALVAAVESGGQGTLMLPTEILAQQQCDVARRLFEGTGIVVELLTGNTRSARRKEILDLLISGGIDILVGTQSLIQSDVHFQDLRLAVIDEQQRFGVAQRRMLLKSNSAANMLMMTATPIPRSLALVRYGEADISVLTDKPEGRVKIRTAAMPACRRAEVIERLRAAMKDGRQAYWICPVVEDASDPRYATPEQRAAELSASIDGCIGFVHGQMLDQRKIEAMSGFVEGKIRILVATTVVEVGMDVPNASIMVIESAECFGLAQLHQLRGRIGRGSHESACVLIYNAPLNDTAKSRLSTIRKTSDGFKIADADLELRGAGELAGTRQSGFHCADPFSQGELLEEARSKARSLVEHDPNLVSMQGLAIRNLLFLFDQDHMFASSG